MKLFFWMKVVLMNMYFNKKKKKQPENCKRAHLRVPALQIKPRVASAFEAVSLSSCFGVTISGGSPQGLAGGPISHVHGARGSPDDRVAEAQARVIRLQAAVDFVQEDNSDAQGRTMRCSSRLPEHSYQRPARHHRSVMRANTGCGLLDLA